VKIKKFFLEDIDDLLKEYDFGESKHKPDVLKQIKEIEIVRENMNKQALDAQKNGGQIMIERPGDAPIAMTHQEIVQLLTQQKNQIDYLTKHVKELEDKNQVLLKQLLAQREKKKIELNSVDEEYTIINI
jgi:hypothetical protein